MASTDLPGTQGVRANQEPELDHIRRTTESIVGLEQREREPQSVEEHLGERITAVAGSLSFVYIHVAWFGTWMAWNTIPGLPHFDEFPFTFLTLIVSLEAIFLSTFVLISQNRQSARADRSAMVDLEVNVIAERELTKILEIVADIQRHITDPAHDREVEEMISTVHLEEIKTSMDDAEARMENGSSPDAD